MSRAAVTREEVLELLVSKLAEVLDVEASTVTAEARLEEDLYADSLDLVEVVEGVERRLRARGLSPRLPEGELLTLRTVGDAADRLLAACSEAPA